MALISSGCMPVTYHKASWWLGHPHAPAPRYPGLIWHGRFWNRRALRNAYRAWRKVEKSGAGIHIGEFGCFNRTPHEIAVRWLRDMLSLYKEFGWGYAMWNFQGPFGIIEHKRPDAQLELIAGYHVDRALLDLMLENQVS